MRENIIFIASAICAVFPTIAGCNPPQTKSGNACEDLRPHLVSRDDWNAGQGPGPMECLWSPVLYVIIHHTVGGSCNSSDSCVDSVRKLQKDHVSKKNWPDVGYHFMIGGDGKVYEGRPWNKVGGHTKNQNRRSIGIAFLGNYQKETPGPDMMDLVPKIAYCGVEKGYLHPSFVVIGHKDAFCSTCPGDALYAVIKKWSRFAGIVPISSFTCDTKTTPATTTTMATTTTTTTTEPPTTEALTTTTEKTKKEEDGKSVKVVPIYVYLLLSKEPTKCCSGDKWPTSK